MKRILNCIVTCVCQWEKQWAHFHSHDEVSHWQHFSLHKVQFPVSSSLMCHEEPFSFFSRRAWTLRQQASRPPRVSLPMSSDLLRCVSLPDVTSHLLLTSLSVVATKPFSYLTILCFSALTRAFTSQSRCKWTVGCKWTVTSDSSFIH